LGQPNAGQMRGASRATMLGAGPLHRQGGKKHECPTTRGSGGGWRPRGRRGAGRRGAGADAGTNNARRSDGYGHGTGAAR